MIILCIVLEQLQLYFYRSSFICKKVKSKSLDTGALESKSTDFFLFYIYIFLIHLFFLLLSHILRSIVSVSYQLQLNIEKRIRLRESDGIKSDMNISIQYPHSNKANLNLNFLERCCSLITIMNFPTQKMIIFWRISSR